MCLYGLGISISYFSAEYAIFTLPAQPNYMPAGEALAWIASWMPPIINGITVFYILLFPTGRLPSRRWRWLAWLTAGFCPGGCFIGFVLFWSANGHSWPDPKSARDRGLHQRLQKAVAYKMLPALTGAFSRPQLLDAILRTSQHPVDHYFGAWRIDGTRERSDRALRESVGAACNEFGPRVIMG